VPGVDLLLIDIAVIVLAARLTGTLLARLGQPPVIGEILAGILLGPTLLGHVTGPLLSIIRRRDHGVERASDAGEVAVSGARGF
jgi:predicted Kef-type K+ transport protein